MESIQGKNLLIYITLFFILFSSFGFNAFNIVTEDRFENYDHFSECLVVGKLARAKHEGIFTQKGFPGISYDLSSIENPDTVPFNNVTNVLYADIYGVGYKPYFEETSMPDDYYPYLSQIGGQSYVFAILDKISPFSHEVNYHLFKLLNAILLAMCMLLILAWINRNLGLIPLIVTFILILFSPWILLFSGTTGTLWWCIWSLFLPFIATLLLLEKRHAGEKISNTKIYAWIAVTIFAKFFFSGFEFATVPIAAVFSPIIYYYFLEKKSFKSLLLFSLKVTGVMLLAITFYSFILLVQLGFYFETFSQGIEYFFSSYTRRTSATPLPLGSMLYLITVKYLKGNAFDWGFINTTNNPVYFLYLWMVIAISGLYLFLKRKQLDRKYIALLLTTFISIICPFSWFYIFRNHAYIHLHINFIIWYIPTMILGFSVIGVAISLGYEKLKIGLKKD